MKLAIVTEQFDLTRGGAERSSWELAASLSRQGLQVTVIAGKIKLNHQSTLPFVVKPINITAATRTRRWYNFQQAVREHLAAGDYDIVHSLVPLTFADLYQPRGGSIIHSTRCHARSYSSPITAYLKHAVSGLNLARRARILEEKKLCSNNEGPVVVALSSYVARQFKNEYHLPDSRLCIIQNGIDIEPFRDDRAREEGMKLRKLYDPENKLALFIFAAENLRLKGLEPLIKAARMTLNSIKQQPASSQYRDFRMLVISRQNYKKYWRLARRLNLGKRIIFMGSTKIMPALMNMSDAVVLPTFNDACSRIILEGLAAGKPGITTRFNGAADFLENENYGFVIKDGNDIDSLASALLNICNPQQQQQMSHAIETDRLYERVSLERHSRQLIDLYQQMKI